MVIPFETRHTRFVRLDEERREKYLEGFRSWMRQCGERYLDVDEVCSRAGDVVDAYARELLHAVRRGQLETREDLYHCGIGSIGPAIRDAVADPSARHAVAQTLQERVLRAELRFREAAPAHRMPLTSARHP